VIMLALEEEVYNTG